MFIDNAGRLLNDGAHVRNGQGFGVGNDLAEIHYETGLLRPYINNQGVPTVTINTGRRRYNDKTKRNEPVLRAVPVSNLQALGMGSPVVNATSLRKEEWIQLDRAVHRATRQRLRAWADLEAANPFGGFDGMGTMTYEYEAMSDPGEAVVDMDAMIDGRHDEPLFKLRSLPLPITHSDFWYSERRLAVSRNRGTPLDTVSAEAAGRRIAETIEQTVIGTITGITYGTQTAGVGTHDGTSTVYGYTNYPNRITKTNLTIPLGSNPEATMADVIAMRELLYAQGFFGPFMIYTSTAWDAWLDNDYFRSGGTSANTTLRARINAIDGIRGIRRLDFLTSGYQMIMVQMTSDVARAIVGMRPTVVQWDAKGGLKKMFKVMAIMVPLIQADYNGRCGIVHATTS